MQCFLVRCFILVLVFVVVDEKTLVGWRWDVKEECCGGVWE